MSENVATRTVAEHRTLRFIAMMEAVKGFIVFGAGFGMLSLLHRDVRQLAVSLVTRLHLDPDRHSTGVFLNAAAHLTDARLWGIAALALAYSSLRWVEAYGLWANRRWASWLGAASGAIYVPIEIFELWEKPSAIKAATLVFNVAVVLYLLWTLQRDRVLAVAPSPQLASNTGSSSSSPRNPPL